MHDPKYRAPASSRLRPRWGDLLVVAVVVLLAGLSLAAWLHRASGTPETVQVWQNGTLIREVPLWSDVEFTVEGDYTNTVRVEYGRVAVVESDCPTQVCVHTGWCRYTGQTIVCLPNGVEIRLVGGDSGPDIDAVTG